MEATALAAVVEFLRKHWASIAASLAFLILIFAFNTVRHQRDALRVWQGQVVTAITAATVPPDAHGIQRQAAPETVVARIHVLADNLHATLAAIAAQNAAITTLQVAGEQRQEAATAGAQAAQARNAPREATRRALEAPGRSTGLSAAEWNDL